MPVYLRDLTSHTEIEVADPTFCLTQSQFQFKVSAQDGIVVLWKAHTRTAQSVSSIPEVAIETVPMFA